MAPLSLITFVSIVVAAAAVGSSGGFFQNPKDAINLYLMGFFRDLSRMKATKRRMQNNPNAMMVAGVGSTSIITTWDIILQRDDPLAGVDFFNSEELSTTPTSNNSSTSSSSSSSSSPVTTTTTTTFTMKELQEFGNGKDGNPIYLSIFGRVYDVSAGQKFYAEHASYGMFAGKDVTRALCLGCKDSKCLIRSTEGLTTKQINEGKRWLSFFELHDKYHHVGDMEIVDSDAWLDALVAEDTTTATSNDNSNDNDSNDGINVGWRPMM